jgi:hypothetical protein
MTIHFADQTFRFANGYGASVIHDPRDWRFAEIAVTNDRGEFVYETPITQDVLPLVDPLNISGSWTGSRRCRPSLPMPRPVRRAARGCRGDHHRHARRGWHLVAERKPRRPRLHPALQPAT